VPNETPLTGGRVTAEVVRVGDTVRRPAKPNSPLVRALLAHFLEVGFDAVPRYLGHDEKGRETFSFLAGNVPADLDATFADETLAAAAQLIRRFHDATTGTAIAEGGEVVCHNDLSPCNFVFRDARPVGVIDFDTAAPGRRLEDLGYAIFAWLNLGHDGPAPGEQARRIKIFCHAYGIEADQQVIDAILDAVAACTSRLHDESRTTDAEWWQAQLNWLDAHRTELRLA
jgi:hypothetical protein